MEYEFHSLFNLGAVAFVDKKVFNNSLPLGKILCLRGGEKEMAYISVNQNEGIENALRRFKRKVMTEEIIKDLKKHAHFIPPGQKAKLKSAMARKRNKKRNRMRPMNNNFNNNNNNNFNNNNNNQGSFNRD